MYVKRNLLHVDRGKIIEVMKHRNMTFASLGRAMCADRQNVWFKLNEQDSDNMRIKDINRFAKALNWNATDFLVVDYVDRDIVEEIAERNVYRRKVNSESQA